MTELKTDQLLELLQQFVTNQTDLHNLRKNMQEKNMEKRTRV